MNTINKLSALMSEIRLPSRGELINPLDHSDPMVYIMAVYAKEAGITIPDEISSSAFWGPFDLLAGDDQEYWDYVYTGC